MHTLLDVQIFAFSFFYLIVCSDLFDLSSEYNSECTLLPQKLFAFIGSSKRIKGRPLAKSYTSSEAVGVCMNLCAAHEHCNAINFKRVQDSENCVLFEAARIVETENGVGWLAYTTTTTCIPGCYRNVGMCLQQINGTKVRVSHNGDGRRGNRDEINNGIIQARGAYRYGNVANQLVWIGIEFEKRLRVVRVVVYIFKEVQNKVSFDVKVGSKEVEKAKYCAEKVDLYPGDSLQVSDTIAVDRKDIYCPSPLDGQYVYFSKLTDFGYDSIWVAEAIIFAEKM